MEIRDRIKELRRIPASQLIAHPSNWRQHPPLQTKALKGILGDIGFADAVIARETPEGLQLIDGHLRQSIMGDQEIPVLVVDLTDAEADKMLLTLDPLAAMAESDNDTVARLLESVSFQDTAILDMLQQLGMTNPDFHPVGVETQGRLDEKSKTTCPECGHEFTR